jgi:hypothetical protein
MVQRIFGPALDASEFEDRRDGLTVFLAAHH